MAMRMVDFVGHSLHLQNQLEMKNSPPAASDCAARGAIFQIRTISTWQETCTIRLWR
jgi:hypothetical protein